MLNPVGRPATLPKPNAKVLTEALNLVTAFGNDKSELAKLLKEMKSVQELNEQVYENTLAAIKQHEAAAADYEKRRADEEKSFSAKLSKFENRTTKFAADLDSFNKAREEHNAKVRAFLKESTELNEEYSDRAKALADGESALATRERELVKMEEAKKAGLKKLKERREELEKKFAKMSELANS